MQLGGLMELQEISSEAAMELNKYNKALQARWGTAEEVVVQASHLVIEQQAQNHTLTVSQKNNPKISLSKMHFAFNCI